MNDQWLIWSHEHGAYWREGAAGYTEDITEAGRYPFSEARKIVKRSAYGMFGNIPQETMLPYDSVLHVIEAQMKKCIDNL